MNSQSKLALWAGRISECRSVIATRRLLQQGLPTEELDLSTWKSAIHLLMRNSESPKDKDALTQLVEAAAGIGITIHLDGSNMPQPPIC